MSETTPPNPPDPPESESPESTEGPDPSEEKVESGSESASPPGSPPPPPVAGRGGNGGSGGTGGSGDDTLMLVLSYLGPFALIPFLVEKDNPEIQWHAKNGLVLLGAELVFGVLVAMANAVIPCLPCVFAMMVGVAALVLHVVCIVKALNGERFEIPGLSPLVERF